MELHRLKLLGGTTPSRLPLLWMNPHRGQHTLADSDWLLLWIRCDLLLYFGCKKLLYKWQRSWRNSRKKCFASVTLFLSHLSTIFIVIFYSELSDFFGLFLAVCLQSQSVSPFDWCLPRELGRPPISKCWVSSCLSQETHTRSSWPKYPTILELPTNRGNGSYVCPVWIISRKMRWDLFLNVMLIYNQTNKNL